MKLPLLAASLLLLIGCGEKSYTENDFLLSDELRAEFEKKCQSDNSSNCENALSAVDAVRQAKNGVIEKQVQLGDAYLSVRNFKQAVAWLTRAAENGSDEAIDKLGQIGYLIGSEKNPSQEDKAVLTALEATLDANKKNNPVLRNYLRHVAAGDNESLIPLGIMYRRGEGAEKDFGKAASYFNRYAEAQHVQTPGYGEYYLGYMHLNGEGFSKSTMAAVELFGKSCRMGFKLSCYQLGNLYFQGGDDLQPDYKKATELLDVYSPNKQIDERAVEYADDVLEMYSKGGFGIDKDPKRVHELKEILCQHDIMDVCKS